MATHADQNPNPSLPEDLVYDILLRLSVKTVLRLVCKSWLSLISSSSFIKNHLSKSTNDPNYTHHRLILCERIRCRIFGKYAPDLLTCSLSSLFNESNTRVVDHERLTNILNEESNSRGVVDERLTLVLDYEPVTEDRDTDDGDTIKVQSVVGYCNGLVCLTCTHKFIYLWNPATRKARKLPDLEPSNFERRYINNFVVGFAMVNDDFRVYVACNSYFYDKYELSVYSSKSDCWRLIGYFPLDDNVLKSNAFFANGVVYWVLLDKSYKESHIISLDINTETYREIFLPKDRDEGECSWNLGNFDNGLSLLCKYDNHFDFWVLKKCGVEEFWTKLFTIPDMDTLDKFLNLKPICISVNGEIMLHFRETSYYSTILLYNSKDNTFKELVEMNFCEDLLFDCEADVYTYVESLVSP